MQMMNLTKSQLIDLVCSKDKELTEVSLNSYDLKEQQTILFWLLFITAGIGFMF
jgi:hypothetical protein